MFWTHKTLKFFGKFPVRKDIHGLNKKRKVGKKGREKKKNLSV